MQYAVRYATLLASGDSGRATGAWQGLPHLDVSDLKTLNKKQCNLLFWSQTQLTGMRLIVTSDNEGNLQIQSDDPKAYPYL